VKAFVVTDDYGEGHACVQFAEHSVVARREGANELNTDFESVNCRRAPEFDTYAEAGKVPDRVLVEHGWWFECMQCSKRICDEPYDDDGEPIELQPIYEERGWIFCSPKCRDSLYAEKAEQKARAEAAATAALAKWPGIEICHKNGYENPGRVWFKFPGGAGQADWTQGASTILIQLRDQDAWAAFEASIKAARPDEQS
jgi:hypothetical protein